MTAEEKFLADVSAELLTREGGISAGQYVYEMQKAMRWIRFRLPPPELPSSILDQYSSPPPGGEA